MLQYEEEIRRILSDILSLPAEKIMQVSQRDDLQYVGMDSLNCILLIVTVEERFGIQIPEDKIGMKYVRNIYDICQLVCEVKHNE